MPTTVRFTRKSTAEFVSFQQMDEEICAHLESEVDFVQYICGWDRSIGERLAYGYSFDQIRTEFNSALPEDLETIRRTYLVEANDATVSVYYWLLKILAFIEEHYVCSVSTMPKV